MELRSVISVLFLVSACVNYNIKINPVVKTSVNNLKNTGEHNSIQLSTITNSTILQAAVPHQVYQSHLNELFSTSAILVIFSVLFIILSVIITKITLVLFKLNLRLSQLIFITTRNWYSWILSFILTLVKNLPFWDILSPKSQVKSFFKTK